MKKIIGPFASFDYWQTRCHLLVLLVCLFLALFGQMPDSSSGWVLPIDHPLGLCILKGPTKGDRRRRRRAKRRQAVDGAKRQLSLSHYLHHSWPIPTVRAFLLALCFWHFDTQLLDPSSFAFCAVGRSSPIYL